MTPTQRHRATSPKKSVHSSTHPRRTHQTRPRVLPGTYLHSLTHTPTVTSLLAFLYEMLSHFAKGRRHHEHLPSPSHLAETLNSRFLIPSSKAPRLALIPTPPTKQKKKRRRTLQYPSFTWFNICMLSDSRQPRRYDFVKVRQPVQDAASKS